MRGVLSAVCGGMASAALLSWERRATKVVAGRSKDESLGTRERILDAVVEVFLWRGVVRASWADVGKLAGVTRGAVYGHLESKVDLFSALCRSEGSGDASAARRVGRTDVPAEGLRFGR